MGTTRVIVHGAAGRVGQEVVTALARSPDMDPVGAVDIAAQSSEILLPDRLGSIPYRTTFKDILESCDADVVVDFSVVEACRDIVPEAANKGLHLVIGTTGLTESDIKKFARISIENEVGIVVAPNFALGAVLLNHLTRLSARFFEYVDIFEAHHEGKVDAPSGTSIKLAHDIANEIDFIRPEPRIESIPGTRGGSYKGISIHSTRMPGRSAHHEVVFGGPGQTLSLRHDVINRECYMAGVLLAIKEVTKKRELILGLENILGL